MSNEVSIKKIIAAALALFAVALSGNARAVAPEVPTPTAPASQSVMPPAIIDEVEVPYEVLIYAQTEYQGYAVTHALKIQRMGREYFVLQVSRDDHPSYSDSIYLLYDSNWNLIGEEKSPPRMPGSPEPKKEEPAPENIEEQPPAEPAPATGNPVPGGNNNNQGGGNDGDNQDDEPPADDSGQSNSNEG